MVSFTSILLTAAAAAQSVIAFPTTSSSQDTGIYDFCTLTIGVGAYTVNDDTIRVAGSIPKFGNWVPEQALQLRSATWAPHGPIWWERFDLPVGTSFEYKLLWTKSDGSYIWEKDQSQIGGVGMNRVYTVPVNCTLGISKDVYLDLDFDKAPLRPTEGAPPPAVKRQTTCEPASIITVDFGVQARTLLGESIRVVGNVAELGNWDPEQGVVLSSGFYNIRYPFWHLSINLPAGVDVEYKYVAFKPDGEIVWEGEAGAPNRNFSVPTCQSWPHTSDAFKPNKDFPTEQ